MNKINEIKHSKTGGRKYMELTGAFWQDAREAGIKIGERRGKKAVIKEGRKAGIKEGREVGHREGTDEAIIKLIPDLVALSNDRQTVIKILMNKMNLSQAQAESYYERAMAVEQKEK